MRIAHVLSHVAAVHAGVPIATRKLGRALVRLGVDVSFWTTGDPDEAAPLAADGIEPHIFDRTWPRGWRYSPDLSREFERQVKGFDVVHIHEVWDYPQLATARAARKHRIPYVWAPRASLEPWRIRYKGWKKRLYLSLFGNRMMAHAACMHAVSAAETDGFRQLGFRGTSVVVNNGIDPEEFASLPNPAVAEQLWPCLRNRRVVLFLSRISPEKGIDQLLSAWQELATLDRYADTLLVLAGPDDRGYRAMVEDALRHGNLADRVLLTGMVSGTDKLALISRADLYVLPSYSEGFSNSILENLAAAKPVLITPGCNFPEVAAAGAGLCVEPASDQLSTGLLQLLDLSREDRLAMGQRGKTLIMENYTWEIAARKLVTVYQAILTGGTIPEHPVPAPLGADGTVRLTVRTP